jgi:hypothetical protein
MARLFGMTGFACECCLLIKTSSNVFGSHDVDASSMTLSLYRSRTFLEPKLVGEVNIPFPETRGTSYAQHILSLDCYPYQQMLLQKLAPEPSHCHGGKELNIILLSPRHATWLNRRNGLLSLSRAVGRIWLKGWTCFVR